MRAWVKLWLQVHGLGGLGSAACLGRGLIRPCCAPSRPAEVLGVGIHARAFDRTGSRIEPPWVDWLAGPVGVGFSLSDFLRRLRLRPFAGPGFGHIGFAFALAQPDPRTATCTIQRKTGPYEPIGSHRRIQTLSNRRPPPTEVGGGALA